MSTAPIPPTPSDPDEVVPGPKDVHRSTSPPDGEPLGRQPKWRQDFPIDWAQDEYVSRRELVKFMVLTSLAFVTGQFWLVGQKVLGRGEESAAAVLVAGVDELPIGGSKVFYYPTKESAPRLLIRVAEDRFLAYDQQCTHLLCPVVPDIEDGLLHCPCHEGYFDLEDGSVVAGPPRRPLPRVHLEIRGDEIYAIGIEEPLA